ncbi:hypothetical protein RZS08_52945, partial [Arthrospira platensis SPKY1]|nr:hypothetical protein [Arthrospira platensis SPKY1]
MKFEIVLVAEQVAFVSSNNVCYAFHMSIFSAKLDPLIAEILPQMVALRRDLHAHPELCFEEQRTAARVLESLQDIPDVRIEAGFGQTTGVIVTLGAEKQGPCVALRADMDALPLTET